MPRITYGQYIETQYPAVQFTGFSDKHRSYARNAHLKLSARAVAATLMNKLIHGQAGGIIWQHLRGQFSGTEWLVKGEELEALLLVDFYSHMTGKGDVYTKNKLTNPHTGNKFHLIALKGTTVGGIRVWISGNSVNYRFRLEEQNEKDATTRARTSKMAIDAMGELKKIVATLPTQDLTTEFLQTTAGELESLRRVQAKHVEAPDDDSPDSGFPDSNY